MITNRFRDLEDAEIQSILDRNPNYQKFMLGGRHRHTDAFLAYDIHSALWTIHKGRWNYDPRVREALARARDASKELADAIFAARRAGKWKSS